MPLYPIKDSCYTANLEMNESQSWCGHGREERDHQKLKCIPSTCCQSVPYLSYSGSPSTKVAVLKTWKARIFCTFWLAIFFVMEIKDTLEKNYNSNITFWTSRIRSYSRIRPHSRIRSYSRCQELCDNMTNSNKMYSHTQQNDYLFNDGSHIREWSHKIIIL